MAAIPNRALDEHNAIVGKVGSGKTYAAKGFVEQLLSEGRRVCILDPTGAWWGLRSNAPGDGPGFPVAVFGGEHADLPVTVEQAEPLAHIIASSNLPTVIDLSGFTTSDRRRFATRFLDALYHKNRDALHLIVDEADEFAPQKPGPDQTTLLNRLDQIVRRGRVKGFRVMMITQRPAVLNKDVLSQASTLIAMKLTSPQDRNALGAWIEGQADREEGKKLIDSLPRLERGQGWVWWPEGELLELTAFPKIATFDSSRTPEAGQAVMQPTGLAEVDLSEFSAALAAPEVPEKRQGSSAAQLRAEYDRGHADGFAAGVQSGRDAAIASMRAALEALAPHGASPRHEATVPKSTAVAVPPKAMRQPSQPKQEDAALVSSARKILATLARNHPAKFTWNQVGTLAGLKASGGHWNTGVKQLRSAGYVEEDGDVVSLAPPGLDAAGTVDPAPSTPSEVLDMWCARLPSPAPDMLRFLVSSRRSITIDQLAAGIDRKPTGGHWNTGLSILRTNHLIEQSGRGSDASVRAADMLVP